MHLLLAQKGSIADGGEAVDLGQSPGEILFLSAADTELAAVAAAAEGWNGPSLRLASLMSLRHPMSVDTYVERTLKHAKLVVVRALGGAGYFQYLLEAFHAAALRSGALIAALPGDDRPDPALADYSNVSAPIMRRCIPISSKAGTRMRAGFSIIARRCCLRREAGACDAASEGGDLVAGGV